MTDFDAVAEKAHQDHLNTVVRPGVTILDLDRAFKRVAVAGDWKAPIDAVVNFDGQPVEHWTRQILLILEAIEFFTATTGQVQTEPGPAGSYRFRFTATGYRNGPAGP